MDIKTGDVKLVVSSSMNELDVSHEAEDRTFYKQGKRLSLSSNDVTANAKRAEEIENKEQSKIPYFLIQNPSTIPTQDEDNDALDGVENEEKENYHYVRTKTSYFFSFFYVYKVFFITLLVVLKMSKSANFIKL